MNKIELRHHFLQKRLSLDKDDVDFLSRLICEKFFTVPGTQQKQVFHVFLPILHNKEINTWPIINYLWESDKKVIVPVSDFINYQMANFYLARNTLLKDNKYGIPEPLNAEFAKSEVIEVVVMPLLAFDSIGYRVGYGKGFYDKFISCLKQPVLKIGLSFFEPIESIIDIGEWDERMDYCVTPENIYSF